MYMYIVKNSTQSSADALLLLCSKSSRKCDHAAQTTPTWTKPILTCFTNLIAVLPSMAKIWMNNVAMRFELATRSVTSPDSENFAPLELQDSLTWKILALPYQKYTFSERKFHEEFKYGIQYDIGSGTKLLWLKIFGFWGPQKRFFARSISHSPFDSISNSTAYLNSS